MRYMGTVEYKFTEDDVTHSCLWQRKLIAIIKIK